MCQKSGFYTQQANWRVWLRKPMQIGINWAKNCENIHKASDFAESLLHQSLMLLSTQSSSSLYHQERVVPHLPSTTSLFHCFFSFPLIRIPFCLALKPIRRCHRKIDSIQGSVSNLKDFLICWLWETAGAFDDRTNSPGSAVAQLLQLSACCLVQSKHDLDFSVRDTKV